jgi:hypothetical protein
MEGQSLQALPYRVQGSSVPPGDLQELEPQCTKETFPTGHDVVKRCVSHLGLDHPKLGEMAASLGFFRAKRRTKTVSLAERRGSRFVVELS